MRGLFRSTESLMWGGIGAIGALIIGRALLGALVQIGPGSTDYWIRKANSWAGLNPL